MSAHVKRPPPPKTRKLDGGSAAPSSAEEISDYVEYGAVLAEFVGTGNHRSEVQAEIGRSYLSVGLQLEIGGVRRQLLRSRICGGILVGVCLRRFGPFTIISLDIHRSDGCLWLVRCHRAVRGVKA